jgi:hypothetical protein
VDVAEFRFAGGSSPEICRSSFLVAFLSRYPFSPWPLLLSLFTDGDSFSAVAGFAQLFPDLVFDLEILF